MPYLKIYFASKTIHAAKWREIDLNSPVLKITSRWIKHVIQDGDLFQQKADRDHSAWVWIEDQQDIHAADYLVLYAERGEHLRGGLVEAGIAMEHGVPIIVIGEHPDYGSWQWHPQVMRIASLEHLEVWAKREIDIRIANMTHTYLQG